MTTPMNEAADAGDAIVIQSARSEDLDAVLALLRNAALPENFVREHFESFLVATRHERVIGSCGLERYGSDGLLRSVVVAPAEQRGGVGRRLTERALQRAREQHLDGVYLLTTTARGYFEGLGFEVVPRESAPEAIRSSWEFSNGCPSTATFMRRTAR